MLLAPDAWPSSCGRTAERTTFATGAKKSAIPTPATMNGAIRDVYGTSGVETRPIHASATACRVSPVPMMSRGLIRSESAPATGAMNIGASVHGRMRSPAPSGE